MILNYSVPVSGEDIAVEISRAHPQGTVARIRATAPVDRGVMVHLKGSGILVMYE
jgi:hypothetical protein